MRSVPAVLVLLLLLANAGQAAPVDPDGDPLPPGAVARMGSMRLRHVRAHIAFAADGKSLLSAGADRWVRAWDVASGRLLRSKRVRRLMPHGFLYFDGAMLNADGKLLALQEGQTVYLHDAATGEERGQIPAGRFADARFVLSPDGKTLALWPVMPRAILQLWDVATGKQRAILTHPSWVGNFAFSADSTRLASSSADGLIYLWDTSTGKELCHVRGEGRSLAFAPDGKRLAASDNAGTVTLWETANLKRQATLKPSPGINGGFTPPEPLGLAFSPDGSRLAVAGYEALVLWDVAERRERRRWSFRQARSLVFAPDGKTLAGAGEVEIHLWDVATGQPLHQRPGHDGEVSALAVSPDGKVLASAGGNQPLHLWDAATGKPLAGSPNGHFRGANTIFSRDGKWLVCAGDSCAQLWDVAAGKERRRFAIEDLGGASRKHQVWEVSLSADGRRLAALSIRGDRFQLNVWDARTGRSLARRPYQGQLLPFSSLFAPDGEQVVVQRIAPRSMPGVQSADALTLEDTITGRAVFTIPRKLGYPMTFSPDGKLLAAGIHLSPGERGYQVKSISVTEMATGEEVLRLDGPISPLVFSADGRLLATLDAIGEGGLRVWDVATGQRLFRRAWPEEAVHHPSGSPANSLVFIPGNRRLATGMMDGTVLVWDLAPETWPKADIAAQLDREQTEALWADLAGAARKAHRAIYTLAAAPKQALPFLAEHLRPAAAVDAPRVEKLLADLESEEFRVREAAARELTRMGEQIEPTLQRVLANKPSLEMRNRIRAIQTALRGVPPAATLRTLRAIRVLEAIGTAEARQLLHKLAGGAAGARATRAAEAALTRLNQAQ